ncbi:hypothetical protein GLYMA_03G007400v4 [Glycine max]|uniref:Uncharacterized protein n=2 Tax=Glycine subgen. Soja TaxID=1462606 RepID=I1JK60_SOYBN|nr:uncharacterized protein LOC100776350 [Glycine max]XP_028223994.1 uncharacterized protein LOC114405725 [Glycine soja]KAG5053635.1 hypothetical protein JHK85_006145 [Glycine max]KAG5070775.1 hypothetical protein JHK86_005986 [Glycine max]KAH1068052.1 hypothetical protein GYH30_005868 [Glycine max]KAH1256048.1 hypothetical protein GmHk_03G006300 [Glycine max]KHN42182.1 hypothetical protein glysoja_021672 [Glycine soja]|eukprot:XP_003521876.1 uncharacterized protein LOC100776350 [Glycine max]
MRFKSPLQLLIILLVFSFVLSSAALQTTRRLLPNKEKTPTQITSDKFQGVEELKNGEEMFDMAEEFMVERRIDLESNDYPGTGANNRHDPKTPGGP